MDPPSPELVRTLTDLGLATGRDLQRARARVRRLGRGLPVYDSLWIDALVRQGTLTLFQSRLLETKRSMELKVAPGIVLESPRHLDPCLSDYFARDARTRQQTLVLQFQASPHDGDACEARLEKSIQTLAPFRERLTAATLGYHREDNRFAVISPAVSGQSLGRLLVRRGRFSESVVRALLRELAGELASVEGSFVHGDLRLSNVLLGKHGQVSLLHWGILTSLVPTVTIHTRLPVDAYDGLAPERIDAAVEGRTSVTTVSDIYACGCLIWQLLTGRPPFTISDPLVKIAAHRQRQIPDVRTLAPDTSAPLAHLVRRMTSREPHRRPQSFQEVLSTLESPHRPARRRLKQFIHTFESAAPRAPSSPPAKRLPLGTSALVVTAGSLALAFLAWNRSLVGLPPLPTVDAAVSTPMVPVEPATSAGRIQEPPSSAIALALPLPDRDGIVRLESGGTYHGGTIKASGDVTLIGDPESPPMILVQDDPLVLQARRLTLQNIVLRVKAGDRESAAINVVAQELVLRRCHLHEESRGSASPLIEWSFANSADPHAGRLLLSETSLDVISAAITVRQPLSAALLEHVYKQGPGSLLDLSAGVRAGMKVPLILNNCTFRESGPLVRFREPALLSRSGRLSIQGEGSVCGLATGTALVEFIGPHAPRRWEPHVEIVADGLIVPPKLTPFGQRDESSQVLRPLESNDVTIDGLLTGTFRFQAATDADPPSVVIESLPFRLSSEIPGADRSRLLAPLR